MLFARAMHLKHRDLEGVKNIERAKEKPKRHYFKESNMIYLRKKREKHEEG